MKKLSKIILAAVIIGVMSVSGTASADDFRTDEDNLIIRLIQGRIERKHHRSTPKRLRRHRRHMPPPQPDWRRDRRHRKHMPSPPPHHHHGHRLPPPRHRR